MFLFVEYYFVIMILKTKALNDGMQVDKGDICFCKINVGNPRYIELSVGKAFSRWIKNVEESYTCVQSDSYNFNYCIGGNYCPSCRKEKDKFISADRIFLDKYCLECSKKLGKSMRSCIKQNVRQISEDLNIIEGNDLTRLDFANNIVINLEDVPKILEDKEETESVY